MVQAQARRAAGGSHGISFEEFTTALQRLASQRYPNTSRHMAYLTPVVRGENGAMLFTGTTAQLLSFLCYDLLTTHVFAVAFASICRCVFNLKAIAL